jgi:serine protease AprX
MLKRLFLAASLLLCIVFEQHAFAADYSPSGLKMLAVAPANAYGTHDGVATFGGVKPTDAQLNALRGLGLKVQGFRNLPLAMLRGPKSAMVSAVRNGLAEDVYPNERLKFFSAESNFAIKANEVHQLGIKGKGIGVAVVDSGVDGTHPALAKRVKHNTKVMELGDPAPTIMLGVDQGPYNNSDTSSGHGTHVAGIVAADGTGGVVGVAPEADLIGYGTGEAIFVFGVLWVYDDIISHKTDWNIRVINNSWGSSFRLFDPDEPINQATREAHRNGIVVVFAAGNASTEMSLNPYSAAPWVISVGNGTLNMQRSSTSSGGIEFDNATLVEDFPVDEVKKLAFTGDRIGLYHPSLSAPGTNIVSTATLGAAVTGLPGGTASASGTSMASPHIAGVAALMIQKNPKLTPDEVKVALQVTSQPMPSTADPSKVESFYAVGYGWVNARAAVDLIGRMRYNKNSGAKMQVTRDKQVLGDRDFSVIRTDYFSYVAPNVTVNGVPETRVFSVNVPSTTKAMKALVSYPSLGYVGENPFNYQLTVKDAAGKVVGQSTPAPNAGMSQLFVNFASTPVTYGTWTIEVFGESGANDQDVLMGNLVSIAAHQLAPQLRVAQEFPKTNYTATGSTTYYFTSGPAGALTSPEGCNQQVGAPVGGMSTTRPVGTCQSANMGYAINYGAEEAGGTPAVFTSAPLAAPMVVGGTATMKFYLVDPLQPQWQGVSNPRLVVEIDAVDAEGNLVAPIASGDIKICPTDTGNNCFTGTTPTLGTYTMNVPPVSVPAGSRLSVTARLTAAVSSASRTLYGGAGTLGAGDFSQAGITLTTGALQ